MASHQALPSLGFSIKSSGVGCHFLLQCVKVKSESEVAQSCPTLPNPMDCSPPGSSAHEIFQARVLEWVSIAFSTYIYVSIYIYLHAFALARISSKMLDSNHERGYTNFVPGLSGKAFSFSSFSMMLPVGFL